MGTPHYIWSRTSGLGHFHAYQTINDRHITSMVAKTIKYGRGGPPVMTATIFITPTMMFAQRFALRFNTRDRRTRAIDVSINIAPANKPPGGRGGPFT